MPHRGRMLHAFEESCLMRDRMLHDSLRVLTGEAAQLLEDLLAEGAEIPFEVGAAEGAADQSARGSVKLFAYRPLTAEFVSNHAGRVRGLPAFEAAAQTLARTRGTAAYLRTRGEPVLDVGELTHARLGVLAFLSAVWRDAERFDGWGERFERAYRELESVVLSDKLVTNVFIPVHGVRLREGSINLGAGVELLSVGELDRECSELFAETAADATCFCSLSVSAPSDAPTPMPAVRLAARELLTALRLFRPGGVSLGMTAQADIAGSWHQLSMPFSGRSREDAWLLHPEDEEELRQFVSAVRRIERRTRIAWALKRFETGLENTVPADGLTDFLLAMRALLEAEDDRGKAALPARVSALCAQEEERVSVRQEVEAAFALERLALNGSVGRADRKRLANLAPLEVIAAIERHLRALLHDLVCGYLSTDLKALADEILAADGMPPAEDQGSPEPAYLEPVPDPGAAPAHDPTKTAEFESVFDDTAEIMAVDLREDVPAEAKPTPLAALPPEEVEEVSPPQWDASPERRPVGQRRPSEPGSEPSGFTFDFQPIRENEMVAEEDQRAGLEQAQGAEGDTAFPIPEFGVPSGRGPAARRSDEAVEASDQNRNLREIMDENARHPERASEEDAGTPLARRNRSHLRALGDGPRDRSEQELPRIVEPGFDDTPPFAPDPQLTIEYDVLGAETSAEESAQLVWSRQFLRQDQESDEVSEQVSAPTEPTPEAAGPPPIRQLRPVPDPVEAADPGVIDGDRRYQIGPPTVEFRPVVEADPDDPGDFSGAC